MVGAPEALGATPAPQSDRARAAHRVRKALALAADQEGSPEASTAAAIASRIAKPFDELPMPPWTDQGAMGLSRGDRDYRYRLPTGILQDRVEVKCLTTGRRLMTYLPKKDRLNDALVELVTKLEGGGGDVG